MEFKDKGAEEIYDRRPGVKARALLPVNLHRTALIKLTQLAAAATLEDLKQVPENRLEALNGTRAGQYSIRINGQYRICFRWEDGQAKGIEIVDYH